MSEATRLYGRLFLTGHIHAVTGLHIGGSEGDFAIGKNDNPVITNPVNGQPYVPGSSLRGKMRSLTEKYMGRVKGQRIAGGEIHTCTTAEEYATCPICKIYGRSADDFNQPTRLIVRDVPLLPDSAERLLRAATDLPFTELKTEVSIDRVTSQANPRPVERVPASAVFGPMELVLSFYAVSDAELVRTLVEGMSLLEDDYLGGHGSRGSGKVAFSNLRVLLKRGLDVVTVLPGAEADQTYPKLAALVDDLESVSGALTSFLAQA